MVCHPELDQWRGQMTTSSGELRPTGICVQCVSPGASTPHASHTAGHTTAHTWRFICSTTMVGSIPTSSSGDRLDVKVGRGGPWRSSVDRSSAFAKALRQHRSERCLTQADLAERAHLSKRAISDLERGLKIPQRATVRLLIEALSLSPDESETFEAAARTRAHPSNGSVSQPHNLPVALNGEQEADTQRLTNLPMQRRSLYRPGAGCRCVVPDPTP